MNKKPIKQLLILDVLGISQKTLIAWKKKGCPSYRRKQLVYYHPEKVRDWLVRVGKYQYINKIDSYFKSEYEIKNNVDKLVADINTAASVVEDIDLENFNIFEARKLIGSLLKDQVTEYKAAQPEQKGFFTKGIKELTEQLRKLEESCIEIDKQLEKVMLVSEAQKLMGRICNNIKNKFLNLPGAVCEQLAGMSNPIEVEGLLKKKTVGILRELSDGLNDGSL